MDRKQCTYQTSMCTILILAGGMFVEVTATCGRERPSPTSDEFSGSIQAGSGKPINEACPIIGAHEAGRCSDPVP